jgi:hypothetical protein
MYEGWSLLASALVIVSWAVVVSWVPVMIILPSLFRVGAA